jgi:C1A family cysteine protease
LLSRTAHTSFLNKIDLIPNSYSLQPTASPVENQGNCGSCYDFSLIETLRDSFPNDPGRLSFMYLLNCAKDMSGCNGGSFEAATHLVKPSGPPSWSFQPYTGVQSTCKKGPVAASSVAYHMLGGNHGPSVKDIAYVIGVLHRPVSTEVAADDNFEAYPGGTYSDCTSQQIDHMVVIEGYDCQGPCNFDANGNLPPGKGTYLVRNSWGSDWGLGGYIRMLITDTDGTRCNAIATEALYFDVSASAPPPAVDLSCHGFLCGTMCWMPWCKK